MTQAEIRRLIQRSANRETSGTSYYTGHGIIDAQRALFLVGEDSESDSSSSNVMLGSNGLYTDVLCYPNPLDLGSDSQTECVYYLTEETDVDIWIYSRRGQLIYSESSTLYAGKQSFYWSGLDASSNQVPNGVYQLILNLSTSSDTVTKKHMLTVYE